MERTPDDETGEALPLVYLEYGPRQPAPEGKKPPLLLMLHGVGANERDLFPLAPELDPRLQILSLRAPLTRGPNSYAWFTVAFLPTGFKIAPEQLDASRKRVDRVHSRGRQTLRRRPGARLPARLQPGRDHLARRWR